MKDKANILSDHAKKKIRYVLITPARNEGAFIEKTIQSVVSQTLQPEKWVIVSEGSTDGTDEIVKKYLVDNPWIELLRISGNQNRNFAAKVNNFNSGYEKLKNLDFELIANIDADISFGHDYFEFLLDKFDEMPKLGVAGTSFIDSAVEYDYSYTNIEHVSGQCQVFRRKCFEEIGGYKPIKGGGIDWVAVTTARMQGWETRTFTEKSFIHHKPMGSSDGTIRSRFKYGRKDYYLGAHPVWEFFRCLYQMRKKPYVIGGLVLYFGYIWSFLNFMERPISSNLVRFRRSEEMRRLRNKIFGQKRK